MIRAVIFDFGGVLVRTIHNNGREKWEQALHLSPGDLSREVFDSQTSIRATLGEAPEQAIWDAIARNHHLTPGQSLELRKDFWSGDRLDSDLVDYLAGLRGHVKTAILSNAWSDARLSFTNSYHLDQAVDLIVISAEEHLAKPDPKIYQLILDRLHVFPEETVFVDDFVENIKAAGQLGMHAILFTNTRDVIARINTLLSTKE